jgi:hypothetical protein
MTSFTQIGTSPDHLLSWTYPKSTGAPAGQ